MKHIKKYEKLTNEPKIGDYVICKDKFFTTLVKYDLKKYQSFIYNNIGKIIGKDEDNKFIVKYNDIPIDIKEFFQKNNTTHFNKYEIIHNSKNKEDLEIYLSTKKYNI